MFPARRPASPNWIAAAVSRVPRKRCATCAAAAGKPPRPTEPTLPEAKKPLKRPRERQMEALAADEALIEIDAASSPLATAEKLAEQGFGPRLKASAHDRPA